MYWEQQAPLQLTLKQPSPLILFSPLVLFSFLVMSSRFLVLGLMLNTISHAATASLLQSTGSTAVLGGISYWIPPQPIGILQQDFVTKIFQDNPAASGVYLPLTVIQSASDSSNYTTQTFDVEFSQYLEQDDVWTEDFSSRMILALYDKIGIEIDSQQWSTYSKQSIVGMRQVKASPLNDGRTVPLWLRRPTLPR